MVSRHKAEEGCGPSAAVAGAGVQEPAACCQDLFVWGYFHSMALLPYAVLKFLYRKKEPKESFILFSDRVVPGFGQYSNPSLCSAATTLHLFDPSFDPSTLRVKMDSFLTVHGQSTETSKEAVAVHLWDRKKQTAEIPDIITKAPSCSPSEGT
jgi:hypothetical protein